MTIRRYTNYIRFKIINKEMVLQKKCELPNYARIIYKHQREYLDYYQELSRCSEHD